MTDNPQPEAIRIADEFKLRNKYLTVIYRDIKPGDEARDLIMHPKMAASSWSHVMDDRDRLLAYCQELESQVIRDCMTQAQNLEEIEHVASDVSKNGAESNMKGVVYAKLPISVGEHKYGGGLFTEVHMRDFADATHALRTQSLAAQAPQQQVQEEPVVAAVFDEQLGRPVLVEGAPLLKHGQPLYTAQSAPSGNAEGAAQEDILHCYWMMLRECESKADDDNDPVLRHQVEGFYRLWNRVQGSSLWPIWVERAARKEGNTP